MPYQSTYQSTLHPNKTAVKQSVELVVPATLSELERFCKAARDHHVPGSAPCTPGATGEPNSVVLFFAIPVAS